MRKRAVTAVAAAIAAMLALDATPALAANSGGHLTMYRLYNPYTGEHFYTADESERDAIAAVGWRPEGTGWVAPERSSTPVYRLYNSYVKGGDHHYTTDRAEYDHLVKVGWTGEGVGWYSDDERGLPLHRLYNPYARTGTHHYTLDEAERDSVAAAGWRREGVAWYGVDTERLAARERARLEYEAAKAELSARQADADSAAGALAASEGAAAALRDDLAGAEAEVEESSAAVASAEAALASAEENEPIKSTEVQRLESLGSLGFFQSLGEGGAAAVDVLTNPVAKVAPYVNLAAPGDPTSLANLKATVPYMRKANELRSAETNPYTHSALPELMVSPFLMAVAEVQISWTAGQDSCIPCSAYGAYEIRTFGYQDPDEVYERWSIGGSDSWTYKAITNARYDLTGFAIVTPPKTYIGYHNYAQAVEQTFCPSGNLADDGVPLDEFEAALDKYCAPLDRHEDWIASWQAEVSGCRSSLETAKQDHAIAVVRRDSTSERLEEVRRTVDRDRLASSAAKTALEKAQEKANEARKRYEGLL